MVIKRQLTTNNLLLYEKIAQNMITLFTVECMYSIRVDVVVCTCLYYKFNSNGYTYFKLQDKKVKK